MEEWHQKLHNNTSPDDVVICQVILEFYELSWPSLELHIIQNFPHNILLQALIYYINSDFDIDIYWNRH